MQTVAVSVSNKDGTILLPRVFVALFLDEQSQQRRGKLTLSAGQHLFSENYYELLTGDGQSFEIFVSSVSPPDVGGFCTVKFTVSDSGRL